jgi:Ca2+-binding EF-hand superfamily protein
MLACFCFDKKMLTEVREEQMDKVELAFRKFDMDGDGFLSWEEFQQVRSVALIDFSTLYIQRDFNIYLKHPLVSCTSE